MSCLCHADGLQLWHWKGCQGHCKTPASPDMGQHGSEPKGYQPRVSAWALSPLASRDNQKGCSMGRTHARAFSLNKHSHSDGVCAATSHQEEDPAEPVPSPHAFGPCSALGFKARTSMSWFTWPGPLPAPGGCQMGHRVFSPAKKKNQQLLVAAHIDLCMETLLLGYIP